MNAKNLAYSEKANAEQQPLIANPLAAGEENAGVVDSLLHPLAILIRQVLTRTGRLALGLILIDDEENILQALEADVHLHSLYFSGDERFSSELIRKLPAGVRVHEVAKRTCKKLFENDKMSRVFAIAHAPVKLNLESILEIPRDIVVLEDLSISGNIGSIIRTAMAFCAGGIVLLNADSVDIYDRRLIRASRGHVFSLPIFIVSTEEFICFCEKNELPIVVMVAQADHVEQEAASCSKRLMIVLGSEKNGCSEMLRSAGTLQVRIPTYSRVESLNVSTAAAIMLYNRFWFNDPQVKKGIVL